MGRTALYRDPIPYRSPRVEVQLDFDSVLLSLPAGRPRAHPLDGCETNALDGCCTMLLDGQLERRFVRMLILERPAARGSSPGVRSNSLANHATSSEWRSWWIESTIEMRALRSNERTVLITPPEDGAVAPAVVRVPEAPQDAIVIDACAWDALADWVVAGGRFATHGIADLARLATIATPGFAVLIGEVAAQRALEIAAVIHGPLRTSHCEVGALLQPLADAARKSPRAGDALTSALAHIAGASRRRRITW